MMDHFLIGKTQSFDPDILTPTKSTNNLAEKVSELFAVWSTPVYRYLVIAVGNVEEAEDITQEVFLRLYRHVHSGGVVDNVRFWVFRVAHNLAMNHHRRQKFIAPLDDETFDEILRGLPDETIDQETRFIQTETFTRLHAEIGRLTPQERQCLHLRAEGLKYREIAEVLNLSISAVSEFVRRGIKKITV